MNAFIAVSVLILAGCATSPEDSARQQRVQVFQVNSQLLTCDQLRQQVAALDADLLVLDKDVDSHQTTAIAPLRNLGCLPLSECSPHTLAQTSADKSKVARDSGQQRRDVLMRQFYAKRCVG